MRPLIAIALLSTAILVLLVPASADARDEQRRYTNAQLCRRMTRQINHFEGTVLAMARARDNALWEKSTEEHIDRLKNRRADKCPEWGKQRTALAKARDQAIKTQKLMAAAAKAAAKYFTGGFW